MPYRYNYGALMSADPTSNNNFEPLNNVVSTADYNNWVTALLEDKGLVANTPEANTFIANANAAAGNSQIAAAQNIASLSESDTAVARGDTWGGSDDTMGKSWLEKIVAGDLDTSNIGVEDLYQTGFGRTSDQEGLDYWTSSGQSIQKIAEAFLASEEATYRTGYHDYYGRDADQAGLDYWMTSGGTEHHGASDTSADFSRILQHTGDEYEQKETSVRNLLSSELGIHSSDAQRLADTSLHGADGIAGTDDDLFTDASEADVFRMMTSDDLGGQEVADKVKMQTAAQYMGDYGGGVNDVGATNIHRKLANQEMGTVVTEATGDKWVSDPTTLAKTAEDYLPYITYTYDSQGNVTGQTTHNQWGLLKENTQDYGKADVEKVLPEIGGVDGPVLGDGTEGTEGTSEAIEGIIGGIPESGVSTSTPPPTDKITVSNETVDYMPNLHSDIQDTSKYGDAKAVFDATAQGIIPPDYQDNVVKRSVPTERVGGSAKGVRLKRSAKFTSGVSAQGTKQLARKRKTQQPESINVS